MLGVDVSFWKRFPDWSAVKGIEFAILGITEERGKDYTFEHNYQGCVSNGIKVGGYKYSYARNGAESRAEAQWIVDILGGRKLDLPLFIDLEWTVQENYTKARLMEIIEEFRQVVEGAGYEFGIYCNKHWYYNIIPEAAKKYNFWIGYPPVNDYGQKIDSLKPNIPNLIGWQYSWKGNVPGIGSEVDMDEFYIGGEGSAKVESEPQMPEVELPTIYYGSTGNWVRLLQIKLNRILGESLETDGIFGEKTNEAVITFQIRYDLEPDGIAGPVTFKKLLALTEDEKSVEELALEVILGFWGNGADRKKLLKNAGYKNYKEIQNAVNELLG